MRFDVPCRFFEMGGVRRMCSATRLVAYGSVSLITFITYMVLRFNGDHRWYYEPAPCNLSQVQLFYDPVILQEHSKNLLKYNVMK